MWSTKGLAFFRRTNIFFLLFISSKSFLSATLSTHCWCTIHHLNKEKPAFRDQECRPLTQHFTLSSPDAIVDGKEPQPPLFLCKLPTDPTHTSSTLNTCVRGVKGRQQKVSTSWFLVLSSHFSWTPRFSNVPPILQRLIHSSFPVIE